MRQKVIVARTLGKEARLAWTQQINKKQVKSNRAQMLWPGWVTPSWWDPFIIYPGKIFAWLLRYFSAINDNHEIDEGQDPCLRIITTKIKSKVRCGCILRWRMKTWNASPIFKVHRAEIWEARRVRDLLSLASLHKMTILKYCIICLLFCLENFYDTPISTWDEAIHRSHLKSSLVVVASSSQPAPPPNPTSLHI